MFMFSATTEKVKQTNVNGVTGLSLSGLRQFETHFVADPFGTGWLFTVTALLGYNTIEMLSMFKS